MANALTWIICFVAFVVWVLRADLFNWLDHKRAQKRKGARRDAS